jgi:hypothetical protein
MPPVTDLTKVDGKRLSALQPVRSHQETAGAGAPSLRDTLTSAHVCIACEGSDLAHCRDAE